MKISFLWEKVHMNQCPNILCKGNLIHKKDKAQYHCDTCTFVIVDWKLEEIKKGKESRFYKSKAGKCEISKEHRNSKMTRLEEARLAQQKEIEFNRKRMSEKLHN